jgi:hypothetical protein
MSSFTGLYVQRLSTGVISGVHVLDSAGNDNSLDPDVYIQSGIQPPIEQLPDLEYYNKNLVARDNKSEQRTLLSIVGRVTVAAIVVAVITTILSVQYDCSGVAYSSEQCLWARSLFLVTSGIFFVIAWPVCFIVGMVLRWWGSVQ